MQADEHKFKELANPSSLISLPTTMLGCPLSFLLMDMVMRNVPPRCVHSGASTQVFCCTVSFLCQTVDCFSPLVLIFVMSACPVWYVNYYYIKLVYFNCKPVTDIHTYIHTYIHIYIPVFFWKLLSNQIFEFK